MHNGQGGGAALLQRLTDAVGAPVGWRLTTASSDIETYDAAGRLLAITLRAGWTYALAYGSDGKLATVTDTFGGKLTFTYDAAGRPSGSWRRETEVCMATMRKVASLGHLSRQYRADVPLRRRQFRACADRNHR